MPDKIHKFKNKSELAKTIGISRPTLNSRLVKLGVKVDTTPFTLTPLQLKSLKLDNRLNKNHENSGSITKTNKQLPEKNQDSNQITKLQQEIQNQQKQLTEIQDLRIAEQKEHTQRIIDLTNKMIKIQDQAQQLQLDLQTKLGHSEQERLSLLNKTQQLTDTETQVDEKEHTIAELEAKLNADKQEKEDLQKALKSSESFSDYLFTEKHKLDNVKDELIATQTAFEDIQDRLNELQQELIETQNTAQEKEKQSQYLSEQTINLAKQLKETRLQLLEEQNKGFWDDYYIAN